MPRRPPLQRCASPADGRSSSISSCAAIATCVSFSTAAQPLWPRPLAISPIPYGYLIRESGGLWCVGDQAAVIPSFTGDGISIALHSAALAAQMFLAGASAADYNRTLRAQLTRPMTLATSLSRAAVTGVGRAAALAALTLAPNAMRWIAASTRIPQSSLVSGESAAPGSQAGHPSEARNAPLQLYCAAIALSVSSMPASRHAVISACVSSAATRRSE